MRPTQGCTKTETDVLPRMGRWLSSTMAGSEKSCTNETVLLFRIHLLPHAVKQPQCVPHSSEDAALSLLWSSADDSLTSDSHQRVRVRVRISART